MSVFSTKNIRSMLRAMLTGYRQFSLQSAGAYQNSKNFPGSSVMGKCAEFSNHTNCLVGLSRLRTLGCNLGVDINIVAASKDNQTGKPVS